MSNPYPPPYEPPRPQQPPQPGYGQQIPQQPYPSHDHPGGGYQGGGYQGGGYQGGGYPPAGQDPVHGYPPPAGQPPGQSVPGQPAQAQPAPGTAPVGQPQPAYPPAAPQQATYYGSAQVSQPQFSGYDDTSSFTAPPRRRRGWLVVLGVLGALLLVCGVISWVAGRPFLEQYPATLTAPETLVGHQRSTNQALREAANQAVTELRREIDLQDAVAEFYQDPNDETKIVWLVGGTKFILDPKSELNDAFRGASGGMSVSAPTDIDPGPLGGFARCSDGQVQVSGENALKIAICAWADHGSLAIIMFINRTLDEGAELLRQIRAVILTR